MKKLLVIPLILIVGGGFWFWRHSNFIGSIEFEIDEGYRIDYASNPRIMNYEDGVLTLGYEYQVEELKNSPGQRGWVAFSDDGLIFENNRQFAAREQFGKGVFMPTGVYRRYWEEQDGYVYSESSLDGEYFKSDEGVRYNLNEHDQGYMGVRTYLLDQKGGTIVFYNNDEKDENGKETIYVRRAYSAPGDEGLNFVFEDDNVLEFTDQNGDQMSFADLNAILLSDGRIRLIVMWQDPQNPKPPLGRTGAIFSYISDNDGHTFQLENEVVSWDDFKEFEVRSLNDPKIIQLDDGRYRIYVAAMVPDEADNTYKWIIVSVTSK